MKDWERNVWNEMQADAAPSKEEQEQMRKRTEELHAELKAVLALVEATDAPKHIDVVYAVADELGFSLVTSEIGSYLDRWHAGRKRFSDLVSSHLEQHERPDPEEFERQAPPEAYQPGIRNTQRVRELKAEAWQRLPNPDQVRIEWEKRPAGGAVRYDVTVSIGDSQ
jgi:hypothetical protein